MKSPEAAATAAPMLAKYIERHSIPGLAPTVDDDRGSGFRTILKRLRPPERILEVGTIGGPHTTTHLLDVFPEARIDIVEMDTERAELATASFHADPRSQGRVHVHHMDANDFQSRNRFDLLVIDPQTGAIELGYEALLPRLSRLLSKRGGAILYTIYDLAAAYEGPNPPNGREEQEAFMLRYFGATALSLESLQKRMAREGFAALALTDRQMSQGGRAGHGWAYLQRPPTTER